MIERKEGSASLGERASMTASIALAILLAFLVNLLVSRHYKRWDLTSGGRFTLSSATVETLHRLEEPVSIYVLLPTADPTTLALEQLLEAYRAESNRISVKFVDPYQNAAEFVALQQRYGLAVRPEEDGHVSVDVAVIVARGETHQFLSDDDLTEVEDEKDLRVRSRLEQAITSGIRKVLSNHKAEVCFTSGHGEPSLEAFGPSGLAVLRERLKKNNFEVKDLGANGPLDSPTAHREKLKDCRVVVVAGPTTRIPEQETRAIAEYFEASGSVLVAASPTPRDDDRGYVDLGINTIGALAGISFRSDFVFEQDPSSRSPRGFGETFLPEVKPHPITRSILELSRKGLRPVVTVASSLELTPGSNALPILATTSSSFGMKDFFTWARAPESPLPKENDEKGPLVIAYALERPPIKDTAKGKGPRLLAVASSSILAGANWQLDELHGTAAFTESAIAWLAEEPELLDIPERPAYTAALQLTEDDLLGIFRYTVLWMPLASVFLGIAVYLRRRSTERTPSSGRSGS